MVRCGKGQAKKKATPFTAAIIIQTPKKSNMFSLPIFFRPISMRIYVIHACISVRFGYIVLLHHTHTHTHSVSCTRASHYHTIFSYVQAKGAKYAAKYTRIEFDPYVFCMIHNKYVCLPTPSYISFWLLLLLMVMVVVLLVRTHKSLALTVRLYSTNAYYIYCNSLTQTHTRWLRSKMKRRSNHCARVQFYVPLTQMHTHT